MNQETSTAWFNNQDKDEVERVSPLAGRATLVNKDLDAGRLFAAPMSQPAMPPTAVTGNEPEIRRLKLPHAKLVVERGAAAGKEYVLLDDEAHIGRWDADGGIFPDIDLDAIDAEAKVSRRHARIVRAAGGYTIEDLGSTNGTFINRGRRLLPHTPCAVSDGDEIIVGKTFLRLHVLS